jgi:16S rRNA (cytosine1402-N4)-methyltransferase
MHAPVLLQEVVEMLSPKSGEFMIDGTLDGGGHATALIEKVGAEGIFLGIDWDKAMVDAFKERMAKKKNVHAVHGNYARAAELLNEIGLGKADGLLLDLGFSSEQLIQGRGFSFSAESHDEPLLMTYDDSETPVRTLLRTLSEHELMKVLRIYGEERYASAIARVIKEEGKKRRIETVGELCAVIGRAVPKNYERGRINPATRTFQALRIYANNELGNLETVLESLPNILKPGGRVAIISFHSLEDRIVKQHFKKLNEASTLRVLTKKPIEASEEEIEENPRSRSAKLRAGILL